MSERPGVMFYFQDWTPLLSLTDESLARLFRATIAYAADGVWPELTGVEEIFWGLIFPKIDRDRDRFEEKCQKARYSRYRGIEKANGRDPLEFDAWKEIVDCQPISTDVNARDQHQRQGQPQLQVQVQPQSQIHLQEQDQRQGDIGGGRPYAPLPEADFERSREAGLRKIDSIIGGRR